MTEHTATSRYGDIPAADTLLIVLGGVAARLGSTADGLAYVRPGFRPYLFAAGVVMVLLGLDSARRSWLRSQSTPGGHAHSPAVVWLLLVPVLLVLTVPATPLGAFATDQGISATTRLNAPEIAHDGWPPLPDAVDGAVPLTMTEFVMRAADDPSSLHDVPVRLTGFASRTDDGGFRLTRFAASCCAADARPLHVLVIATGPPPAIDAWVDVEGALVADRSRSSDDPWATPPTLAASSVTDVEPPIDPYEF